MAAPRLVFDADGLLRGMEINPVGPHFAPMQETLLINARGEAWMPRAFEPRGHTPIPICTGMALAWTPTGADAILCFHGGNPGEPTDEQLCALMTREGLRALIAGLQSIDTQLADPL